MAPAIARATARVGFWTSLLTAVLTATTFAIAVATPPLSGPLCTGDCFAYPYLDVALRFPRDYYWCFAAIPAMLLYVAFTLALALRTPPERRVISHLAIILSAMAVLTLVGDYFVQLAVVQPSLLAKESEGISLLTQYNPHGIFIALEELGYLLMSISLGLLAVALPGSTRLEGATRWVFGGAAVIMLVSLATILGIYGHQREYRFEIAAISIDWFALIIGASLMTAVYRREWRSACQKLPRSPKTVPSKTRSS